MKIKSFSSSSPLFPRTVFSAEHPVIFLCSQHAFLMSNMMRSLIFESTPVTKEQACDEGSVFESSVAFEFGGRDYTVASVLDSGGRFSVYTFVQTGKGVRLISPSRELEDILVQGAGGNVFPDGHTPPMTSHKGYSHRLIDSFCQFLEKQRELTEKGDVRPIFIYNFFDRIDLSFDTRPFIDELVCLDRQVFISVCGNYPEDRMRHERVQIVRINTP